MAKSSSLDSVLSILRKKRKKAEEEAKYSPKFEKMSPEQAAEYISNVLNTGKAVGLDPDEVSMEIVEAMILSGWGREAAMRCRQNAASRAFRHVR